MKNSRYVTCSLGIISSRPVAPKKMAQTMGKFFFSAIVAKLKEFGPVSLARVVNEWRPS